MVTRRFQSLGALAPKPGLVALIVFAASVFVAIGCFGSFSFAGDDATVSKPIPPELEVESDPFAGMRTLREAVAQGLVEAHGFQPSSYKRVHLRVKNLTDRPLVLDLCGSHLEPTRGGRCQRLGIGPVVTPRKKAKRKRPTGGPRRPRARSPEGTVVMSLTPGGETSVELNTCCLDSGKPAPSTHEFRVASKPLPAVRERVLRWWADNPDTVQSIVNCAIWQFRDVRDSSARANTRPSPGKKITAHSGIMYRIHNGELMSVDGDGIERFLGTEMLDVFPTAAATYATAYGSPTVQTTGLGLWRLAHTGSDPWKFVAHVPADLLIRDLRIAPDGRIFVIASLGLYRADPKAHVLHPLLATNSTGNLSVHFEKRGGVVATKLRPGDTGYHQGGVLKGETMATCEVWRMAPKSESFEMHRAYWNVRQVMTGALGSFGLTPGGKLRRLVGRSFKNLPGYNHYDSILHVGKNTLWVAFNDRVVASDKAGRLRFENGPALQNMAAWRIDHTTDDILYVQGQKFWRLDAKTGAVSQVLKPVR